MKYNVENVKPVFWIFMLVLSSLLFVVNGNTVLEVKFPGNSNCVAYRTNKSMIFQDSVDVVGLNCQIAVTKTNINGKVILSASIPLDAFHSDDKMRDKFVFEYLQGKIKPNLEFVSDSFTDQEFKNFVAGSKNVITGTLAIGADSFPIKFDLSKKNNTFTGKMITTFTYFKRKPPVAGPFGMVANVRDYLELHFQLNLENL